MNENKSQNPVTHTKNKTEVFVLCAEFDSDTLEFPEFLQRVILDVYRNLNAAPAERERLENWLCGADTKAPEIVEMFSDHAYYMPVKDIVRLCRFTVTATNLVE